MNKLKMTVNLVVVAHPDDEVLGFGATGTKLANAGQSIQAVILCGNANARTSRPSDQDLHNDMLAANKLLGFNTPVVADFPNIMLNTVAHLELVQFIETQIIEFQPQRIFTHHPSDLNDDHVQVSKACMAAARLFQRRADVKPLESLYFMEVLSSTDWAFPHNTDPFKATNFVEITDEITKKLDALACYRNVMREFPHPRSTEIIKSLAAYRGGQAGQKYSEAFQCAFSRHI